MSLSDAELLERLVAFDTTSSESNLPMADYVAGYLRTAGAQVELQLSPEKDKANVVASVGPVADGSRRGLVLSGHMDVVPAREGGWRHSPFELANEGDRFVARGACDMKGFLAVAMNLAAERAGSASLRSPLALIFTFDEEVGCLGARYFVEQWPAARSLPAQAIIGEPTSLSVARAHKGHLKLKITLEGRSAHSGYPHLGVNAIEPAASVVDALAHLRRTLETEQVDGRDLFPEVPFVPLNVGTIAGGSAINVVPDRCTIEVGIRPLPGGSSAELLERVRAAVTPAAGGLPLTIEELSDTPPLLLPDDSALHRYLCTLVDQKADEAVSFATDGGWFQKLGMDCAIFGPGAIAVAHRPNEWIAKDDLVRARLLVSQTIDHFCVEVH
jgi:acetylornithine deacetylase